MTRQRAGEPRGAQHEAATHCSISGNEDVFRYNNRSNGRSMFELLLLRFRLLTELAGHAAH